MTAMEIALLVLGAVAFVASFIVPEIKKETEENHSINPEHVHKIIEEQVEEARQKVDDIVKETTEYAVEKTERSLEKLSNEKIMAVNEYSDTVLEEINKNHKEVMFLYDMLNEKQEDLKSTIREVENTKKSTKESFDAARETAESVESSDAFMQGLMPEKVNHSVEKVLEPVSKKDVDVEINFEAGEEDGKNKNERILILHESGKSNVAIAKELGLGVGEVKLVIDLFEGANE